jgi:hypothetical protein
MKLKYILKCTKWGKIFAKYICDKAFRFKINKNLSKFNSRKAKENPF